MSKTKKIVLSCVLVFVLCVAALLIAMTHVWKDEVEIYETENPYITEYGKTMTSAHRSGGGIFPEDTMMAFEGCINSDSFRTDVFEFDLHITKDGELIILHDDTLDRTTNSQEAFGTKEARPENYTLAELKELNFGEHFVSEDGNAPYAGLRGKDIPDSLRACTLEEVLDYLEASGGFSYIIEIKNGGELGFKSADRLYRSLKERDLLSRAIIGTFKGEVTQYLDETYPDMLRSASIKEVVGFYFDSLFGAHRPEGYYAFDALQIPSNQFVIALGNSRLVNYAHKNDIAVQYWTINEADEVERLVSIGADCIMSDIPDMAYKTISEFSAQA